MSARAVGSLTAEVRAELRLLWRGLILPVLLLICALFAVANVGNQMDAVRSDFSLVQHTRAEYKANGMDFTADLAEPAHVVTHGNEQSVTNLARYDYDNMASSIVALSPASSVSETLKYFGFVFFPALFFLLGLWMSTVQRRYHVEKVALVRSGSMRRVGARQLALLLAAALTALTVVGVDAVARTIATAIMSTQLPFATYPPLSNPPTQSAWVQWGIILLVVSFFGGAGIVFGALTGVFAVPALIFLIWDLVVPFLGPNDPRNWFVVLGHSAFNYTSGFQLAPAIPVAEPIALACCVVGAVSLLGLGYLGIRMRNPLAT